MPASPPRARKDYPRRKALSRDLGRYYEACKLDNRARFHGARLKNYCAAVAWTRVRAGGRFSDYFDRPSSKEHVTTMPRRNSKGRFVKKHQHRASAAAPRRRARRARAAAARRHRVHGYTQHRKGRTVHVRRHLSRAAAAYAAAPARAPRRRGGRRRGRGGGRPVIVVANAPAMTHRRRHPRRHYYARVPPIFSMPGMLAFGAGGIIGAEAADMGARYFLGMDPSAANPTLPSGITSVAQYNDLVMAAPPSLKRVGIELGIAALGFIGGGLAARAGHGILALLGYGWGFGGLFHLGTALVDGYLVQPMFVSNNQLSNNGQRMYQHEYNAKTAKDAAAAGNPPGTIGAPPHHGMVSRNGTPVAAAARPAQRALPAARPTMHVAPAQLATVGQPTSATLQNMIPVDGRPVAGPGVPPKSYGSPVGNGSIPAGCAPDCNCGGSCAKCQGLQVGQPPDDAVRARSAAPGYAHPMMRNMISGGQRSSRVRAA